MLCLLLFSALMANRLNITSTPLKFSLNINPMARILKSESIHDATAPYVVSYSSRGPNHISPDILKPDITAPGMDLLAAFCPVAKLTSVETDKRHVNYNILSGTSMSCPHVSAMDQKPLQLVICPKYAIQFLNNPMWMEMGQCLLNLLRGLLDGQRGRKKHK